MLTVEQSEAIRRAYFVDDKSVRAIARELHHGRRVIREVLAGDQPQPPRYRRRKPKPRPVIEPVMALIDAWLTADQTAPRKQRHTAKRIYDRLVAEHGFLGSERIVRQYVHEWKRAHAGDGGCFLPLAYAPGAEAQCDWGEAVVEIAGVAQTAFLFCLRLCYSLKPFVCAFPTARQECFLAGHLAAFAALGGVPRRITYDNLGSAVTKILQGRTRQEHEQFVAFRGHYLFESHFCLPGRAGAHEKPLVESLVGYARRNFLVPVPAVDSWEALNRLLAERCAAEDARTVAGRDRPIGALWEEEQARLRPVPPQPFACCRTIAVKATRQALVSFARNRYSVPSRYAGERLVLRAFPWHVELSDGQTVVARHPRLYGRDGEQLDQYDFSLMPQLNKPLVLELARGHYLDAKENVLLVGQIGTGKTHVATALGVAACRQGARVRFLTAAGLVNELLEAQAAHRLSRYEQGLLRLHLLILDEVGFVPFTKLGADLLFSVLSALHEQVSLVITTTVPFAEWATLFGGDQRLAAALLDRLTFHSHLLQFAGESFRLRQSLKRQEQERRRG